MGKNCLAGWKLLFIFENVTNDASVENIVCLISVGMGKSIWLGEDNTSASSVDSYISWWKFY